MESLDVKQTKDMFIYMGEQIIDSKPLLTEIDSAIGDGDHGIGMAKGFSKVIEELEKNDFSTINEIFKTVGMSMIGSMGGASGVIFGTVFIGGTKGMDSFTTLNIEALADIFENSLKAVKERGKADLGDKTMIDALEPAFNSLKEYAEASKDLLQGLTLAEEAAKTGVENTKKYIAKFGRAKSLGERAIGNQDAGATSVYIMFESMRDWVERNQ